MSSLLMRSIQRSGELDVAVWGALPDPYVPATASPRHDSSFTASLMAMEHARALRLLVAEGMVTTAIGVARMQFEALCRAMWLLYAATDDEVAMATAVLTPESEKEANKRLPMAAKMVDSLREMAPPGVHEMMSSYKEAMLKGLHSFVHAGLHPLQRHVQGYPERLLVQIVANCNGVFVMTGAFLAILAGSQASMRAISGLQRTFLDCLPELVAATGAQMSSDAVKAPDVRE